MPEACLFRSRRQSWFGLATAVLVAGHAGAATAQVDNLAPVLTTNWFLGSSLAAFTYAPTTDTMYVSAYGNPAMVRVTNVATAMQTGTSATPTVYESTLQLYYRDGNPDRGVTTPLQGGLLLNPLPIGGMPAYSLALVADGGSTRFPATTTVDPAATKKIYTYDLGVAAIPGDGTDVFTTRATLADLQAASGATSTSSSQARQFAWSGDGQSIYFTGFSAAYAGIWKLAALSGGPQRLLDQDDTSVEPAVMPTTAGDRILISGGGSTGNVGGIDAILHTGTSTGPRHSVVTAAALSDFFEVSGTMPSQRVQSLTAVGDDLYFIFYTNASSTKPESRYPGVYRYDAEGRLSKVVNRTQRTAALGSVNLVLDRLQSRTVSFTGTAGTFAVPQLLYRESGVNAIAGATAFRPVDFNRDDQVTPADLALFVPQVTVRGQTKTAVADLTFDMNGNDTVDWKDVQIVQGFLDYVPDPTLAGRVVPSLPIQADADLNGVVDFGDFLVMSGTFGASSAAFTQGDFNGDNEVSFPDLQPWINSYGFRSAVVGAGVPMAAFDQVAWDQFLAGLTPPSITIDVAAGSETQFEAGYRTIVIAASVTKTGTGTLVFDAANTYTGTTSVSAGTLELVAPAAVAASTLRVGSGATATVGAGVEATAAGLDLAGGLVDVTTGGMTVGGGLSAGDLVAGILAGRGDGSWTGASGITSSAVAADVAVGSLRAVGWLDNGDGSVRFAYSAPGDTNIDLTVDILDAANFLALGKFDSGSPASWLEGDFTYDGIVDILDAADFFATGLFDAGSYAPPTTAITAVPEPSTALTGSLAAAFIYLLRQRRAGSEGRGRPTGDRWPGDRRSRRSG
jgi:autotransporter-associated beta strand protein